MSTVAKVRTYILIFTIMIAIAIGGILLFNNMEMHDDFRHKVTISEDGVVSEVLAFDSLTMIPGESVGYTVDIESALNSDFIITLDFINTKSGGLEEYVMVEADINGDKRTFSMLTLFEGLDIVYNAELFQTNSLDLRFYMPDTVGNEAQGKFVKFDINLIAMNEDLLDDSLLK